MRLSAAFTFALAALLVASTLGAVAAAPSAGTPTGPDQPRLAVEAVEFTPPEPAEPRQVIRIDVAADGDAVWTVESRYLLEDDADRDAFEAYADSVVSGERDAGYDAETFEQFLQLSEASTEREMHIEDSGWDEPRVEAVDDDDHEIGVLAYSVTWSNFTAVDGDHVYLGDAFRTEDGTWFPTLTENQRLVIERPPDSTFEDVPRGLTDGSLVWDGPYEFDTDELQVTFRVGGNDDGAGGGNGNGDGNGGAEEPPETGLLGDLLSSAWIAAGFSLAALLAAVGVGGYILASRGMLSVKLPDRGATESETAVESGASPAESADETAAAVEFDDSSAIDDAEEVDIELLSDEERVLRLLHQNGGRMKQAMIVKETDWSNAKVSQLLSKMDEDGEIEKLRIGRENLITLPEVDPTEIE